jgi:3-hydroxyisobutyrate dehydrogenase-like beta-hydroxyacid dehydrogenase
MRIGFIGLGAMGSSMALNTMVEGNELIVFDQRKESAEPHLAKGATWVDTPREVAAASEVIFTSLPGPPQVEAIVLGENGLLEGMEAGKAYIDLSTNSPTMIRRIHDIFIQRDIQVLDAPISGGPKGARIGKLAIWVGGDRSAFDRYKPVLDTMGDQVHYTGPIGTGSIAKLVHNLTAFVIQTAMAEAFTMGIKAGADPLGLWQAVRQGAAGRRKTFDGLAQYFLPRRYDPADFALALAHKDVALAVELAREVGVPMRLAELTLEEFTEAMDRGWGQRDARAAMLMQEERAGVEVCVPQEMIQKVLENE